MSLGMFAREQLPRRVDPRLATCTAALARTQSALALALGRNRQLERDLCSARTALDHARAELSRVQADAVLARHQALHDSLTRLPNRRFFRDQLGHALASVERGPAPLAVLYVDLDGFKPINDLHGHEAGDELLRIVAARLAHSVRAEDMVSRLGGDEFACLLSAPPDRSQLCRLATKLVNVVSAPLKIGRLELSVRPSIGIAVSPHDGATAEELLSSADSAMYRAKRQRSGYAFVERRRARMVAQVQCTTAHRPADIAHVD